MLCIPQLRKIKKHEAIAVLGDDRSVMQQTTYTLLCNYGHLQIDLKLRLVEIVSCLTERRFVVQAHRPSVGTVEQLFGIVSSKNGVTEGNRHAGAGARIWRFAGPAIVTQLQ